MKIIAHRSGTDNFPEQTILSAEKSIEYGADLIEVDTRFSLDKKIVINHDSTAERLYGIEKDIDEMTAEEFLSLKRLENPDFGGHLFEEYLQKDIKNLLLHIKEGGDGLKDIIALCREYECLDTVIFGIHSVADFEIVKSAGKNLKTLAFMPNPLEIPKFAGCDYIRLWEDWCNESNIELVKKTGKRLWIMSNSPTVGEVCEGSYEFYKSCGADGILVNKVAPAVKYFATV